VPGKVDWLARARPGEGQVEATVTAVKVARHDVVTCGLGDRVGDVLARVEASPYGFALVTTGDGTILGRPRASDMREADPELPAEQVMEPGPSTVRPDVPAQELAERLAKRDLRTAILTTPEGRLIGVVRRSDLEDAAG
jgi:CBS domain-containing protein